MADGTGIAYGYNCDYMKADGAVVVRAVGVAVALSVVYMGV